MRGRLLTWNAGHCCDPAMRQSADDVGFVNALIDELSRMHPIDPDRIYVTGMSNGGMLSHRLGIELSHRIAAIAPVVATVFGDEKKPANPVSALMLNGLLDRNVPPDGGSPGGRGRNAWDGTPASARRSHRGARRARPFAGYTRVLRSKRSSWCSLRTTAMRGPAANAGAAEAMSRVPH